MGADLPGEGSLTERLTMAEAAGRAREAELARRSEEVFIPRFDALTMEQRLQAAKNLTARLRGQVTENEALVMIQEAERDRRFLNELRTGIRDDVDGRSALDDPDLVRAFERGEFSFRRALNILRGGL